MDLLALRDLWQLALKEMILSTCRCGGKQQQIRLCTQLKLIALALLVLISELFSQVGIISTPLPLIVRVV